MNMVAIAGIQMTSINNIEVNVETACALIKQAADLGAQCVALPEEFATLGVNLAEKQQAAETYQDGPIQNKLARLAAEHKIWLIGGTLPIKESNALKFKSSALVWNAKGENVARYDKIHLFDATLSESESYQESANVLHGDRICVIDAPFGKIGLAICYDVRFPELFRAMMLKGADFFILPSAFTYNTGLVHWDILVKARAIENLAFMIAPNQIGLRPNGQALYGNSLIVGPWGEVLAHCEDNQSIMIAQCDIEELKKRRKQFPVLEHYREFLLQACTIARGNK